ncbi:MAG: DUF4440 domain-containing protein, partial [Thermomicrobiales bacterium]
MTGSQARGSSHNDRRRIATPLLPRADDYTLMSPFGGDPIRGFDDSPECIEAQERFFAGSGEAVLDGVSAQASGDPAVIAAIARQHGEVNSLPPQD